MSAYRKKIAVGVIAAVLIATTLGLVASTSFPSGTPIVVSTLTTTTVSTTTLPGPTSTQVSTETTTATTTTSATRTISASTTTASTSNTSDGLQFNLGIKSNGGVNITVSVEELNLLDSVNNQTQTNQWKYPSQSLNPDDNCNSNGPVGFAVFRGYYGMNNYSQARSLYLYNTTYVALCTMNSSPFVYLFAPLSDNISVYLDHQSYYNSTATVSFSVSGYWTGGAGTSSSATFNPFPSGVYTILGADQWGKVVLLHFSVIGLSGTSSTSTISETCTPAITVTQGSNSSSQTTETITLCHSLSYTTQSTETSSTYVSSTG